MKKCTECNEIKELDEFNKCSKGKNGLEAKCRSCKQEWYQNNREKRLQQVKEYNKNHKETIVEYKKRYQKENKEKIAIKKKKHHEENVEEITRKKREHYRNNKSQYVERDAKYRARKLNATPPWLTKFDLNYFKSIYMQSSWLSENTDINYHVDHIIPLQGKYVCGLHVPWNLQILKDKDNLAKGNKLIQE